MKCETLLSRFLTFSFIYHPFWHVAMPSRTLLSSDIFFFFSFFLSDDISHGTTDGLALHACWAWEFWILFLLDDWDSMSYLSFRATHTMDITARPHPAGFFVLRSGMEFLIGMAMDTVYPPYIT